MEDPSVWIFGGVKIHLAWATTSADSPYEGHGRRRKLALHLLALALAGKSNLPLELEPTSSDSSTD